MENSSQHLPEGEEEFVKTDNALSPMTRSTPDSHILKPLLIGCLTGQFHALFKYWSGLLRADFVELVDDPIHKKNLPAFKMENKRLRIGLLLGATYTTASLGLFEILTEKLRTANNGRPLSVYQEACCGLTSGATAALVWYPLHFPYAAAAPYTLSYGNLFSTLGRFVRERGAFALWKGSGFYISTQMAANMGMLASYKRSQKYLMESEGSKEDDAQMCAGIISGFFAAACSHPCKYVKAIKDVVHKNYRLGDTHSYKKIPLYVRRVLTPYSGIKFYSGLARAFGRWTPFCVVQWLIFEQIHMFEKYMESSTRNSQTNYLGKD